MVSLIKAYLLEKNIRCEEHSILCAVSGGVDSMVMLDCLRRLKFNIGVIHINHHTRGQENQNDYALVKKYVEEHEIPIWYIELNLDLAYTSNFQEKARNLRYDHFTKIAQKEDFDFIATAHHSDDDNETFFINLLRGTGITGLRGIPFRRRNIIRPLKCTNKKNIEIYSDENGIDYLEDSSNKDLKYLRNAIRQSLLPKLGELDSRAIQGIRQTISNINSTAVLLDELLRDKYLEEALGYSRVEIKSIRRHQEAVTIFYHLLGHKGFNKTQLSDILQSDRVGARVESESYTLIRGREYYYIQEKQDVVNDVEISGPGSYVINNGLEIQVTESTEENGTYWFESAPFPLVIRRRKTGDSFKPIGMNGQSKTVKKYLNDAKIEVHLKTNICLVCKNDIVLGIVDYRIAHDCRKLADRTIGYKITIKKQ